MSEVRVRFAPSPTGSLHIGGARTALFNWLFARHHDGKFILRIDDTDTARSTGDSIEQILSSMKWLGLFWDEGPGVGGPYEPYLQSQRMPLYRQAVVQLLAGGKAYYCYCTPEELAERRNEAMAAKRAPRYDGRCRDLSQAEREKLEAEGRLPVIRLRVPDSGETVVHDYCRGDISFANALLDDFIIMKSNGDPTYNFATVMDDAQMRISHILRAEEHLSNTPRQILVYEALGYPLPVFAHLSMILAPDRSKLSKRHGATSVEEFREQGYLPAALINYLALLGWSPEGDSEIMSPAEMVYQFSLDNVGKTAAIYDLNKLTWINGHYLNEADLTLITGLVIPLLKERGLVPEEITPHFYYYIMEVVGTVRTRVKTINEIADAATYFFSDDFDYDSKGVAKYFDKPGAAHLLRQARQALEQLESFGMDNTEATYRELAENLGIKAAELIHPTRLALSGRTMTPGLFDVMVTLGKEKSLERLDRAIAFIEQLDNTGVKH
ncbi:MAG: Glutamate--tRNA ligase 2 [Pelotomaculum sp. PtaB.Bin104]|nr:MAG: Glutamate--tRNA ligase 2 [Pelotomaculum sp. PtaB.Bin104]